MHFIAQILYFQNAFKLYHWYTQSYARHIATDNLGADFAKLVDKFVEVYIGKYGRPKLSKSDLNIGSVEVHNDASVVGLVNQCIVFFTKDINLRKDDFDLLNIRDEILALLNQTKYLFTLQ